MNVIRRVRNRRALTRLQYGLVLAFVLPPLVVAGYIALSASADSQTARPAEKGRAAHPPAAAAQPAVAAAGDHRTAPDWQSVDHAREAAVAACLPAVTELSRLTIDAPHIALSSWNRTDADGHMFESIVGLKYANPIAPHGLSIVMASPNPERKCDGSTVQVQPSSLSCEAIRNNLTSAKAQVADLNGMAIVQADASTRIVLVPTSGNGCAVVGIGLFFAK